MNPQQKVMSPVNTLFHLRALRKYSYRSFLSFFTTQRRPARRQREMALNHHHQTPEARSPAHPLQVVDTAGHRHRKRCTQHYQIELDFSKSTSWFIASNAETRSPSLALSQRLNFDSLSLLDDWHSQASKFDHYLLVVKKMLMDTLDWLDFVFCAGTPCRSPSKTKISPCLIMTRWPSTVTSRSAPRERVSWRQSWTWLGHASSPSSYKHKNACNGRTWLVGLLDCKWPTNFWIKPWANCRCAGGAANGSPLKV